MKKLWIGLLVIFLILVVIDQIFLKDQILNFGDKKYEKIENIEQLETGIDIENLAHDFELQTLDGKRIHLTDLKGKKVLLNFWASWCGPCEKEMPHMQKVYEKMKGENVEIVAVNVTSSEINEKVVHDFVKKHGLTFPIPMDVKGEVSFLYEAVSIPTSYFLDTDGVIRHKKVGPMDEKYMIDQFERLP